MAIYGIGAYHDNIDISNDFVSNNMACVGWDLSTAPDLHNLLSNIKEGDIVFIKSSPIGGGLRIKAIGIVKNATSRTHKLGTCIEVNWKWTGNKNLGKITGKYNVRNNTLFEEFHPSVINQILKLI